MAYSTTRQPLGACCNACANGGARLGLGAMQPVDYTVHPGEDVYHYMQRIAAAMQTEIVVAEAGKAFDAKVAAADAAAKQAAAAGFTVPPDAAAVTAASLGMSSTTKILLAAGAGLALFMLLRRK